MKTSKVSFSFLLSFWLTNTETAYAQVCDGICEEGEDLINPIDAVVIGTETKTCATWDQFFMDTVETTEACQTSKMQAKDAGCTCGVLVQCQGICQTSGEVVLNPLFEPENALGRNCAAINNLIVGVPTEAECLEASQRAQDGGCKCGIPVDCPGICGDGDVGNGFEQVTVGNVTRTCIEWDVEIGRIVDPETCATSQESVKAAGCLCVGETAAPSVTPESKGPSPMPMEGDTDAPTATPTVDESSAVSFHRGHLSGLGSILVAVAVAAL